MAAPLIYHVTGFARNGFVRIVSMGGILKALGELKIFLGGGMAYINKCLSICSNTKRAYSAVLSLIVCSCMVNCVFYTSRPHISDNTKASDTLSVAKQQPVTSMHCKNGETVNFELKKPAAIINGYVKGRQFIGERWVKLPVHEIYTDKQYAVKENGYLSGLVYLHDTTYEFSRRLSGMVTEDTLRGMAKLFQHVQIPLRDIDTIDYRRVDVPLTVVTNTLIVGSIGFIAIFVLFSIAWNNAWD